MMATYPHPNVQLQHAVSQAPQQIQAGHPGPTPHAMQHLHPNQHFQHQQMQAMANMSPQLLQQQRILRHHQQQQMFMNGLTPTGLSGAGNPGVSGNPQNPGMAGFAGANPHMRNQMLHPQMQQHLQQQAQQAQIQQQQQQQQQQHLVAAALANQGVNVQAAGQNVSMPQQQGSIPANAGAASGPGQQPNLQAALIARQQQQQSKPAGQAVLKMHHFNSVLSSFERDKQVNNIVHWKKFVGDFFSQHGLMRQALWNNQTREEKQFEIGNPILPRFFWQLIQSGVYSVRFQFEGLRERELLGGQGMVAECSRAGLIYRYKDAVCFHHGTLKATLNAALQIEVLEFVVSEHQEFVSRSSLQSMPYPNDSPDAKASPHNKQLGKRPLPQGQQASQGFLLPESITNSFGLHPMVIRFLETAETMAYLQDIMSVSRAFPQFTPRAALQSLIEQLQHTHQIAQQHQQQMAQQQQMHQAALAAANANANAQMLQNPQQGHPGGPNAGAGGPQMQNSPHMGMLPGMAGSPAVAEGRLVPPSPHIGQTPSPANQLQAPGQQSQQHPISTSSSQNSTTVGSANTSPNQPNKRRRPSTSQTVKNEVEEGSEPKANNIQNMGVKPMASNKRIKTANPS